MAEAKQFPDAVKAAYDIKASLKPQVTIFPKDCGDTKLDLSEVTVDQVKSFCEKYPKQKYFTAKNAANKSAASSASSAGAGK